MGNRMISAGRLTAVILIFFALAVVNVLGYFGIKNGEPDTSTRYDDMPVYSGTVEEIEAWVMVVTDSEITSDYSNVDTVRLGPESLSNARIKVTNMRGSRWFYADSMSYVCGHLGDECGMITVSKGMHVSLAYGERQNDSGYDYIYAFKDSSYSSQTLRSYAVCVLVPSVIVFACFAVLLDPIRDPYKKSGKGRIALNVFCIVMIVITVLFGALVYSYVIAARKAYAAPVRAHAPVIYLYGDGSGNINVKLDVRGDLTYTYPEYDAEEGWNVTAAPDGSLTGSNGDQYRFLFWEADLDMERDLSRGYCVRGCDTGAFLDQALADLGLNETEAADFEDFWLPFMVNNPYNVITFQTDTYTDAAGLDVSPAPDVTVRVNMMWYASYDYVDIEPQDLSGMNPGLQDRSGLVLVEWGGELIGRQ